MSQHFRLVVTRSLDLSSLTVLILSLGMEVDFGLNNVAIGGMSTLPSFARFALSRPEFVSQDRGYFYEPSKRGIR